MRRGIIYFTEKCAETVLFSLFSYNEQALIFSSSLSHVTI